VHPWLPHDNLQTRSRLRSKRQNRAPLSDSCFRRTYYEDLSPRVRYREEKQKSMNMPPRITSVPMHGLHTRRVTSVEEKQKSPTVKPAERLYSEILQKSTERDENVYDNPQATSRVVRAPLPTQGCQTCKFNLKSRLQKAQHAVEERLYQLRNESHQSRLAELARPRQQLEAAVRSIRMDSKNISGLEKENPFSSVLSHEEIQWQRDEKEEKEEKRIPIEAPIPRAVAQNTRSITISQIGKRMARMCAVFMRHHAGSESAILKDRELFESAVTGIRIEVPIDSHGLLAEGIPLEYCNIAMQMADYMQMNKADATLPRGTVWHHVGSLKIGRGEQIPRIVATSLLEKIPLKESRLWHRNLPSDPLHALLKDSYLERCICLRLEEERLIKVRIFDYLYHSQRQRSANH